jgi:hypothetical protein
VPRNACLCAPAQPIYTWPRIVYNHASQFIWDHELLKQITDLTEKTVLVHKQPNIKFVWGTAVLGLRSRAHWNFSLVYFQRQHYGPGVDSAFNIKITRNISRCDFGCKTTIPPSCWLSWNMGALSHGTFRVSLGLYRVWFTYICKLQIVFGVGSGVNIRHMELEIYVSCLYCGFQKLFEMFMLSAVTDNNEHK